MAATKATVASDTLPLLEERLRRLDYVLDADADEAPSPPETSAPPTSAIARLRHLERGLQSLLSQSRAASEVLALQSAHPDVLNPSSSASATPTLPPSSLAALVLAHANLYSTLSTRLSQLQDLARDGNNISTSAAAAAKLVDLHPRIVRAQERQDKQMRELAELRARSAKVLEAWYEGGVLWMGERWAEWEERVRECEILVRRKEAAKKREEEAA